MSAEMVDRETPGSSAPAKGLRAAVVAFAIIFALGVIPRGVAAFYSLGFVHPDEHQQYLEAAQGIAHGYNVGYWEYERGARHYLYPGFLAGVLKVFDWVGFEDPVGQAIAIRFLLAMAVYGAMAFVALAWLRQGRVAAALCLVAITAFSPDMVYASVRTLSETAALVPLVLAVYFYFWGENRFLAGVFLGVSYGVRFTVAFFILPAVVIDLWEGWCAGGNRRRLLARPFLVGLALSMLALGAIDKATWGGWFHSSIVHFSTNILERKLAGFGTAPWYSYAQWSLWALMDVSVVVFVLLAIGVCRIPKLAWFVAVFFVAHCFIGHKEPRYVWPVLPMLWMLMAIGFEWVWDWLSRPRLRWAAALVVALLLLPGVWFRYETIDWRLEPTRSVSLALAKAGRRDDLRGLAVLGLPDWDCGNYFYLRRNVPYFATGTYDKDSLRNDARWKNGTINYLLTKPEYLAGFDKSLSVERIETVGEWTIYRVDGTGTEESPTPSTKAIRHDEINGGVAP